jgi:hypothetical protein
MKQYLSLIIFISLFAQQVWATGKFDTPNPEFNGLINPKGNTNNSVSLVRPSTQSAYFNLKEAAIRQLPTHVQARSSAISITETDMIALIQPGMQESSKQGSATTTVTMDIGVDDRMNPQTWVLPSNLLTPTNFEVSENTDYIALSDVPLAARVVGATHVGRRSIKNPGDNHIIKEYLQYQLIAGQHLDEMGSTFVDTNDGDAVADRSEAPQVYADAPLDLNDAFTNDITDYVNDDALPKNVTTANITVDGFGTITNPYGASPATFQCLRLSISESVAEYTTSTTTPSSTTTKYIVGWVTKEGFRFYGRKPSENATGSVSLNEIQVRHFSLSPVLAVELLDFQGKATKEGVDLTWTTASEKDNDYYNIERSTDGKTFGKIGQVKGSGTTNVKQSYTFRDERPLSTMAYYRLRQIDFDGTSTTSNIIAIALKGDIKGTKVYPNPTNAASISVEIADDTEGVSVVNAIGQPVFQQKTNGQTVLTVDVSALTAGVYFVKTTNGNGHNDVVKFIKN